MSNAIKATDLINALPEGFEAIEDVNLERGHGAGVSRESNIAAERDAHGGNVKGAWVFTGARNQRVRTGPGPMDFAYKDTTAGGKAFDVYQLRCTDHAASDPAGARFIVSSNPNAKPDAGTGRKGGECEKYFSATIPAKYRGNYRKV